MTTKEHGELFYEELHEMTGKFSSYPHFNVPLHNGLPDRRGSGEANLPDIRVLSDMIPHNPACRTQEI